MAVLVEACSVIVRRNIIDVRFSGGWRRFQSIVPNSTLCSDGDLVSVGFMAIAEVETFVKRLEDGGLIFLKKGEAIDIAIVDQMRGFFAPVRWLEFGRISDDVTGIEVSACWINNGPRMGLGAHKFTERIKIMTPEGWTYEGSLSSNVNHAENLK